MSRYVNIDRTIDEIYDKWGCDPAYIANDTPTGVEARRDAELIEYLRNLKASIDIVRCIECEFYRRGVCCSFRGITCSVELDDYCSRGERRKPNETNRR